MIPAALALALSNQGTPAQQQDAKPAPVIEAKHKKALEGDTEQGKKYSVEVEKKLKLSTNEAMIERVKRIGGEVAAIANQNQVKVLWGDKNLSPFEYTFKVVEGKDVNAFSLPGGFIYVHEGLLTYVESDDELAGVMAHEIAHASLRHIATLQKEAAKNQAIQIPLILAAILTGGATGGAVLQGAQLVNIATTSGWSQNAERAADFAGFQYMRLSRYNPTGSLTVVERLAWDERNRPQIDWGIFRTHPPSDKRVGDVVKFMREAKVPVQRSVVTSSFKTLIKTADQGVETWFAGQKLAVFTGEDASNRAEQAAVRLNAFFDRVPALMDVQSDGPRVLGSRRVLFEIREEDAKAAKRSVPVAAASAVKSIQDALFGLTYKVWQP